MQHSTHGLISVIGRYEADSGDGPRRLCLVKSSKAQSRRLQISAPSCYSPFTHPFTLYSIEQLENLDPRLKHRQGSVDPIVLCICDTRVRVLHLHPHQPKSFPYQPNPNHKPRKPIGKLNKTNSASNRSVRRSLVNKRRKRPLASLTLPRAIRQTHSTSDWWKILFPQKRSHEPFCNRHLKT